MQLFENIGNRNELQHKEMGIENRITMFLNFCLLYPDRQTDGQNIFRIDAYNERNVQREK